MLACYLHTLPGTPFVYQGEELGMTNVQYHSIEEYDDIDTKNYYMSMLSDGASEEDALAESQSISRDNSRTPMQWDDSAYAGFSTQKPWLGVNPNYVKINAANQMRDDTSVFRFYQKLIALRKEHPVMVHGDFALCCPKKGPVIAYTRSFQNETWLVIHNFSQKEQIFEHDRIQGTETIILSNYDERAKERGKIRLRAYETMILELQDKNKR